MPDNKRITVQLMTITCVCRISVKLVRHGELRNVSQGVKRWGFSSFREGLVIEKNPFRIETCNLEEKLLP